MEPLVSHKNNLLLQRALLICYFSTGFVFEAYDQNRQVKVAVKRTQKAGNTVSREYEVMSMLDGAPNVV